MVGDLMDYERVSQFGLAVAVSGSEQGTMLAIQTSEVHDASGSSILVTIPGVISAARREPSSGGQGCPGTSRGHQGVQRIAKRFRTA